MVVIDMHEFRVVFDASIPAGRAVFEVVNNGRLPHSLFMFPEAADAPPLDQQLHGSVRRAVNPLAQVYLLKPGEKDAFAVDLVAGQRYGLMSISLGANHVPDSIRGMNAEFRAGPPAR